MDRTQMIDRLLSIMRKLVTQCTPEVERELKEFYLECIGQNLPPACIAKLGAALDKPQCKLSLLGEAVMILKDMTTQTPPAPAIDSMEIDGNEREGDEQNNLGDDNANSKSQQSVTTPSSSGRPSKRDRTDEEERFPWVIGIKDKNGNLQLRPTQQKTEVMREVLTGVHENWITKDGMSWTQPLPDEPMKLITFQSEGRMCCLLRHVLLYMSIVYKVFVAWEHNLDRERRRRLPLMVNQDLREELGVILVSTNKDTTDLGLLDDYERPEDSRKNKDKKKVLLVVLQGSTPEQIQTSPAVRCTVQGKSEVLSFKGYLEVLMKKLLPVQAAPKRELPPDTEAVPVTVTRNTPKKKKKKNESEAARKELKLPRDILIVRNENLRCMVEYCETMLPPSVVEWVGNRLLDLQEKRDIELLAKLRKETPKHDSLLRVHKVCSKGDDDCEHLLMGRVKCRHDRCDILECQRCPLLMRNWWYLMNLADTIDFKKEKEQAILAEDQADEQADDQTDEARRFLKSKKQCDEDIIKVHKFRNDTQVQTVQTRLQSLRQFLEWYIVNVYDLLGKEAFNDSQSTLIGLFHSCQLPRLLIKWHQSLEAVNRQTSRNKLKDVIDVMECNVEYFQNHCIEPHCDVASKLRSRTDVTMKALYAHMPKVAGAGAKVQMQTKVRLSSTDEGKAPPIQRVFAAHNFLRTGLWDKLRYCRGKGDAHRLPQMILLLAFIKLLMGARAGMLSHMAIGRNLKTIGWVYDDATVDHQKPSKEKGDDGIVESYVKGYAIKYLKEISRRVPDEQRTELRYHVVLLALRKSWYGYKNGHINSRIVPFHREMSMELIVFAASILYIRKETSEDVASLAAKFLEHWQSTGYNTTEAYKWLDGNGKVDFLKLVNDQLKRPVRVFYKRSNKDKYGSHAIHPRGTSDSAQTEKGASDSVTKMLKEAMRTYYASLKSGDIDVDELTDGSAEVKHLEMQASKYTIRGVRSATADYISRLFPFMPEDIKQMLVEQTLMHTFETHNLVYIKDTKYMRCVALRAWMERGAPQAEWDQVEKTTKHQMAVAEEDKVTFDPPPTDVEDMCVLKEEDVKEEVPESSAASANRGKRGQTDLPGSSASHAAVKDDVEEVQRASESKKRKEKVPPQVGISQTPLPSDSKRRRTEKLDPARRSLFTDGGFAEDQLVKIDCCTYRVRHRQQPNPYDGYVWLVWKSCSPQCKKRREDITLEDATAEIYLHRLKFISENGEREEPWAGERFSNPRTGEP